MTNLSLVLLPGLDGTGVLFRPFLDHVSAQFNPIVVSYPADRELGYAELLPVVLAALPATPFVLLGESFSGPLAVLAAAARPAQLRAVILCASFLSCPVPGVSRLGFLVRPLFFRFFPTFAQIRFLFGGYSTSGLRALSAAALAPVRPNVLAHRVRSVLRVNVTREFAGCSVPSLYLRASHDRVVWARSARVVQRVNPSVELVTVPAPHLVLQTQPGIAAAAISTFVRESGAV